MVENIYPSDLKSATYLVQWKILSISSIFYKLTAFVLLKNLHIVLLGPCHKENNTTMEMVGSILAINAQKKTMQYHYISQSIFYQQENHIDFSC